MDSDKDTAGRLAHFPISFFAMVMGLAGLTIAWEKAQHVYGIDLRLNTLLVSISAGAFIALAMVYGYKALTHRQAVLLELRHPVKLNFFPTVSISLLLLSIAFLPVDPAISRPLWLVGATLHLLVTLYVIGVWMHHGHFQVHHLNPAWFIPAVGNVLVPVAGVALGHVEASWFFFSIGLVFWVVLLTIIFNRVLFHSPLDERLMPTLFILIAPPAVGFIAYTRLAGGLDGFGRVLYYIALFLTLLLATQLPRFARLNFYLSWWAYSFPLAAISVASMVMFELTGEGFFRAVGAALLAALSGLIVLLLLRTSRAVARHGICVPE